MGRGLGSWVLGFTGVHRGSLWLMIRLKLTSVTLLLSATDPPLTFVRVAGQQSRGEEAR